MERILGLPDGSRIMIVEHPDHVVLSIMLGYRKTERGIAMESLMQLTLTRQEALALRGLLPSEVAVSPIEEK